VKKSIPHHDGHHEHYGHSGCRRSTTERVTTTSIPDIDFTTTAAG